MKPTVTATLAIALLALAKLSAPAHAVSQAPALVPNSDFTQGTDAPSGWKLSGGQGRWVDRQILEVTGSGKDSNAWQSAEIPFSPGGLYRFQMRARGLKASGLTVSGPAFANHDYSSLDANWADYGHVFRVPDNVSTSYLRMGQWEAKGTVQFDRVQLAPVLPVFSRVGELLLGEGESIQGGRYRFQGSFGLEGGNFHRTLHRATATFNSDRWCFGPGTELTYRFALPKHSFTSGEVRFNVNYHMAGSCVAEASRDAKQWQTIATQSAVGTVSARLPAAMFPAETVLLRLRPAEGNSNFQVNRVEFEAPFTGPVPEGIGQTLFAELGGQSPEFSIRSISQSVDRARGQTELRFDLAAGQKPVSVKAAAILPQGTAADPTLEFRLRPERIEVPAGGSANLSVTIAKRTPGAVRCTVRFQPQASQPLSVSLTVETPEFYRSDYGELLPMGGDQAAVWWCDATRKVPRRRALPQRSGAAATLAAARDDYEAVQIVVQPKRPLARLAASATALAGPNGATIPATNVQILRVHYHSVQHPTDGTSVRDWWPDALPPLARPLDLQAGEHQPLWVLVYVPNNAQPGDYTGAVDLRAEGFAASVPIRLHVWNFTLPEKNHLETAFGFSHDLVFRYHQAKTEADRRKLLDLYFQSFAAHRISPYDSVPLDHFAVHFKADAQPPRAEIDFARFDAAMAAAVEKYKFTNFSLPIQGMGGGTFHSRVEPSIGNLGENTPAYQALFASQVQKLEDHLRQRNWLKMAYVYWFDEPDPKDYEFVRKGMERLKKCAPGIQRMLTEEPNEALAGAVDIWCPITPNYEHQAAETRRAAGDRFWWYVCTGPKAPYCTLFIDHPATELRVWHWQTWQRRIVGTLVWSTNCWTSSSAFPDKPQNPYEDPMGYVDGYDTPKGTKAFWGNGDGRFLYPPEAAAVPGLAGPDPVIAPPVSSIRWEMLREGVEDYEYLWLLRDLLAKRRDTLPAEQRKHFEALLDVPETITTQMTKFTTDSAPIYARRAAIAEAIERLSK